jgi:hypothetical protein
MTATTATPGPDGISSSGSASKHVILERLQDGETVPTVKPLLSHPVQPDVLSQLNCFEFWEMVARVLHNDEFSQQLRLDVVSLLIEFREIFTEALRPHDGITGVDQPVETSTGVGARARVFHPTADKALVLRNFAQTLVEAGVWYLFHPTAEQSRFAVPAFVTRENLKDRLVVDTSITAKNIVKRAAPCQSIDATLATLHPKAFAVANVDVTGAYHGVAYSEDSPVELRLVHCAGRYYVARKLLMGSLNSATYLNIALTEVFGTLDWCYMYADDILLQYLTEDSVVPQLRDFLSKCRLHHVALKPSKANLLARSLVFVGRLVSTTGISNDPSGQEMISSLPEPGTGSDLAKFVGLAGYMRSTVFRLPELLLPLQTVLENIYTTAGSRKSSVVKSYKVSAYGWTPKHTDVFFDIKARLCHALALSHRDPDMSVNLFTDASNASWGGLLTQSPSLESHLPVLDRAHQLLCVMGGRWNDTEEKYPTVELEGLAIQRSVVRSWHSIAGSTLSIYVDHRNLVQILDVDGPYIANKPAPGFNRLVRLAWFFLDFPHSIEYLPGEDNGRADLLSRLNMYPANAFVDYYCKIDQDGDGGGGPPKAIRALVLPHAVRTTLDPDWIQPALIEAIEALQRPDIVDAYGALGEDLGAARHENGLFYTPSGALVVPPAPDIRARILVVLHGCGFAHRSFAAA